MNLVRLADYWRRPRLDAADVAVGLARDFFLAEAVYFTASRSAGHRESEWSATELADGNVRLDAIIPAKFRSSVAPITRVVSNPEWEAGLLSSFELDGRSLAENVRVLRGETAVGWVRLSLSGTASIIAVASVPVPRPTGRSRSGRRIEPDAEWSAPGRHGILVGSPGIWRVPGGWMGGLRHERNTTLSPGEVASISIRYSGAEPIELKALEIGASSGVEVRVESAVRRKSELETVVDDVLPAGDLELRYRVIAIARAILESADPNGAPRSAGELDDAVRSALLLLNAEDAGE
jgi:hypothetical protein